jgi:hypothetical protein
MNQCTHTYSNATLSSEYLEYFYELIKTSDRIAKQTKKKISLHGRLPPLNSRNVPSTILTYINTANHKTYKVTGVINSKTIELYFICYETSNLNITSYSNFVFLILYLLTIHEQNKCSKFLSIKIYLTPFLKTSPSPINTTTILNKYEVNTGYSNIGCNTQSSIVIYRKEEWAKVLIHELFHNLNLDFAILDIPHINRMLQKKFKLTINFDVNECYAEIWGRLLLTFFESFNRSSTKNQFVMNFNKLIVREIHFSLLQATKIWHIIEQSDNYNEKTNTFVYYILTSGLIHNYANFVMWCRKKNETLFHFNKTNKRVYEFTEFTLSSLNNTNYKTLLRCLYNTTPGKSMRMTYSDLTL